MFLSYCKKVKTEGWEIILEDALESDWYFYIYDSIQLNWIEVSRYWFVSKEYSSVQELVEKEWIKLEDKDKKKAEEEIGGVEENKKRLLIKLRINYINIE